jgi:hypothetical protein
VEIFKERKMKWKQEIEEQKAVRAKEQKASRRQK